MIDTALILVLALLLLLVAGGAGHYLLARARIAFAGRLEEACFSVAAGLGALILSVLALGLTGLLYRPAIWGVVLVWLLVAARGLSGLRDLVRPLASIRPEPRSFEFWLVAAGVLNALFGLVRALAPPHGATDPLAYQLALPRIYLAKHFLSFEPTITGALYPSNVNLLYVVGLALGDGSLAQVIHWLTGVLCTLGIWALGERYFSRSVGVWGAVLFSFTPIVVYFGPQGYIDLGLCYFQLMAFWALFNRVTAPSRGGLVLAALLCGLAIGVKHQGLATAVVGAAVLGGCVLKQRQGWRILLRHEALYLVVAFLLVLPWYARAWYWAGNPVWPLANAWFSGIPFGAPPTLSTELDPSAAASAFWGGLLPSLEWFRLYADAMSPWAWTFRPTGMQKDIGVYVVALLPGLLLYLRRRREAWLLGFCVAYYLMLVRFLHMNPRYGLILFAGLSLLCGLVASHLSHSPRRLVAWSFRGGVAATFMLNLLLAGLLCQPVVPVVTGAEARDSFLQRSVGNYRALQFVNANLPATAVVMFQGLVEGYYCDRAYLWGDHPHSGLIRYQEHPTPEDLVRRFRELKVTHVVRILSMPAVRRAMYPDYFSDPFQEAFRRRYLRPLYWDESYVVFEVVYS